MTTLADDAGATSPLIDPLTILQLALRPNRSLLIAPGPDQLLVRRTRPTDRSRRSTTPRCYGRRRRDGRWERSLRCPTSHQLRRRLLRRLLRPITTTPLTHHHHTGVIDPTARPARRRSSRDRNRSRGRNRNRNRGRSWNRSRSATRRPQLKTPHTRRSPDRGHWKELMPTPSRPAPLLAVERLKHRRQLLERKRRAPHTGRRHDVIPKPRRRHVRRPRVPIAKTGPFRTPKNILVVRDPHDRIRRRRRPHLNVRLDLIIIENEHRRSLL